MSLAATTEQAQQTSSGVDVSFDRTGLLRGKDTRVTLSITNSSDRALQPGHVQISAPAGIVVSPTAFDVAGLATGATKQVQLTVTTWVYLDYGDYPIAVAGADPDTTVTIPFQVELPASARLPDVAIGKPATQSSAGFAPANLAVDGNTDGDFFDGSVSHTGYDENAWWQVDLQQSYDIEEIDIWNRSDGSSSRLTDYYVLVSSDPLPTSLPDALTTAGIWTSHQSLQAFFPTSIDVKATGRYVRVQLAGTNYLHMAEVQVFGTAK